MTRQRRSTGYTARKFTRTPTLTPPAIAPVAPPPEAVPRPRGRLKKGDTTVYYSTNNRKRTGRKVGRPKKAEALRSVEITPSTEVFDNVDMPPWEALLDIPAPDGVTPVQFGSVESRRLTHHFLMTHPIQFRRYMIPQISPRGYWHRYTFSPVIIAMKQGDTLLRAGRASGKSFAALEPELVQHALTHPGEESMLTSLRKIHVVDRMERVIEYFETATLAQYCKKILRSPVYSITLHNGHVIYGISVGDDPEAKMAQGKHVGLLIIEEGHQYPDRAWTKIQGAKDSRGCRTVFFGVPDGRTDTPFRMADSQYPAFGGRRFQISRITDPFFTQKVKEELAVPLGGVNSDLYKQEVHAEWGHPTWSAWDLENIYRSMTLLTPPVILKISWPEYRDRGWTPAEALVDFPTLPVGILDVFIAADIGYTQPTEVGVFIKRTLRDDSISAWQLVCRLELTDRFEHDVQAEILWELAHRTQARSIGLDASEGEGRAIASVIDEFAGRPVVTRINFNENLFLGLIEDKDGKEVEVYELAKKHATQLLRTALKNRDFQLSRDDQIIAEFNSEKEFKTLAGMTLIRTPAHVHIPEMFRVAVLTLYFRPTDDATTDFPMPEVGVDFARVE